MCRGGRLLANFTAGVATRPEVPEVVEPSLTQTLDGTWVVWARKLAVPMGELFRPLTGGQPYPRDAVASCRLGHPHDAPQVDCTCGFHAVSGGLPLMSARLLDVALSGRVLAFEWIDGGVLFRAARQTVIRTRATPWSTEAAPFMTPPPPDEPAGRAVVRPTMAPRGAGPIRLLLPSTPPPAVDVADDPGYCVLDGGRAGGTDPIAHEGTQATLALR